MAQPSTPVHVVSEDKKLAERWRWLHMVHCVKGGQNAMKVDNKVADAAGFPSDWLVHDDLSEVEIAKSPVLQQVAARCVAYRCCMLDYLRDTKQCHSALVFFCEDDLLRLCVRLSLSPFSVASALLDVVGANDGVRAWHRRSEPLFATKDAFAAAVNDIPSRSTVAITEEEEGEEEFNKQNGASGTSASTKRAIKVYIAAVVRARKMIMTRTPDAEVFPHLSSTAQRIVMSQVPLDDATSVSDKPARDETTRDDAAAHDETTRDDAAAHDETKRDDAAAHDETTRDDAAAHDETTRDDAAAHDETKCDE